MFLGRDFNVTDIDWTNNSVVPNSNMKCLADSVISSLGDHGLTQLQLEPTYKDHVLDLFCSDKPSLIKSVSTIPGFSDHSFVVIDTVLKPVISKKPPRKIYRWARANWDTMKQKTLAFSEKIVQSTLGVEDLYTSFLEHVKSLEEFIPVTWSRTRYDVPWLSRELKRQCNKKHWLYNRAKKSNKPSHWDKYRTLAERTQKALRSAHWRHINKVLDTAEKGHNPKPI